MTTRLQDGFGRALRPSCYVTSLPRSLKEAIAVVVSKNDSYKYCIGAHNMMLNAIGYDSKKIEELNKDYLSSSLSEKEKAVLDLALKISNGKAFSNPHGIHQVEVQCWDFVLYS